MTDELRRSLDRIASELDAAATAATAARAEMIRARGDIVRAAAVELERLAALAAAAAGEAGEQVCPRCGAEVVQPARGRRRKWCGKACRDAAWRAGRRNAA